MDDIVKAALKKWPNVPHCYGWLALDARGDWYLRDEEAQAAGPFPQVKGHRVVHDKLADFIRRNYERDERGAWFFQNGPQRVYLELEAAPWVMGVQRLSEAPGADGFAVSTHTGEPVNTVRAAWVDENGRLFLETDAGFGIVRSPDMAAAADAVDAAGWPVHECTFDSLPQRFGYVLRPQGPMRAGG